MPLQGAPRRSRRGRRTYPPPPTPPPTSRDSGPSRPRLRRRPSPSPLFLLSFLSVVAWGEWIVLSTLGGRAALWDPRDAAGGSATASSSSEDRGEYGVVTTDYGWDGPTPANYSRRIVTGEFFRAIKSHPNYNASAWADLARNPDPNRRIIAFLDVDTCQELNYPKYGGSDWWKNVELQVQEGYDGAIRKSCGTLRRAATSPALTANPRSRLVVLDCSGAKRFYLKNVCNDDPVVFRSQQVMIAYTSVPRDDARAGVDVGLPPPAIRPSDRKNRYNVWSCEKRRYLYSFQGRTGNRGHVANRRGLLPLDEEEDMHVKLLDQKSYVGELGGDGTAVDSNNYLRIMEDSVFVGAPRGDNLFSYRFAEILSAGAVPVVYADGWLPPFDGRVVNWTACAVFVPEADMNRTGEILRAIPDDVRCRMQRGALEAWDVYVSSREGWVRGLIESALSRSRAG